MFSSPFTELKKPEFKIIFVQDFFLQDLVGGAELSMDALHKSAPVQFAVARSNQLTKEMIETHQNSHWVFGNFANINPTLIDLFSYSKISYSVYEHD